MQTHKGARRFSPPPPALISLAQQGTESEGGGGLLVHAWQTAPGALFCLPRTYSALHGPVTEA